MSRQRKFYRRSFSLVEVILAMTIIAITVKGTYALFGYLNYKGFDPFLDYEMNNFASYLSREISKLDTVTATASCPAMTDNEISDLCHWEQIEDSYDTSGYYPFDETYYLQQFPSISSDAARLSFISRGFRAQVLKVGGSLTFDRALTGVNCPGTATSCTYKNFIIEVSRANSDKTVSFEIFREVDQ